MPEFVQVLARLASALAIGLLVGVERGWRDRDLAEGERTAGIRTYSLIGLLGGISALLALQFGGWAMAAIGLPFAVGFIQFKRREQEETDDRSITAVVAALLVFGLGAYAQVGSGAVAAAVGVAAVCLLASKRMLHAWLRRVTWPELRAALILLAMTFVVLPVLPDRGFGPSQAFNPRELWLLTIVLAGVSFIAYLAIRLFGEARGVLLASVLGALVSSTAMTIQLAKAQVSGETPRRQAVGGALLANAVMAVRTGLLVGAVAPAMAARVEPGLAAVAVISLAAGFALAWRKAAEGPNQLAAAVGSPFEPLAVAKLAAVLGAVIGVSRILAGALGQEAVLPVAVVAGLADVDAAAVASAQMTFRGVSGDLAAMAVMAAIAAGSLSKTVLSFVFGGPRFGLAYGLGVLAALAGGLLAFVLV